MQGSSYLGNLASLQVINLQGNRFINTLPEGIIFLPNLKGLYISINRLEGQFLKYIKKCRSLLIVGASSNHLSGVYPPRICQARQLFKLSLFNSSIFGDIRFLQMDCISLKRFLLQNNRITSQIPSHISKFSSLAYIEMNSNNISAEIPTQVSKLNNVIDLIICRN